MENMTEDSESVQRTTRFPNNYKNNENIKNDKYIDKNNEYPIMGIITNILIVVEISMAIFAITVFEYYLRFRKMSGYVFTWFWMDGLAGIALFIFGKCLWKKISFKKEYIAFLVLPAVSSLCLFVLVVMCIIRPFYESGQVIFEYLCHAIGFPLWIIVALQKAKIKSRYLIGIMAYLIPLARFFVFINIWGR